MRYPERRLRGIPGAQVRRLIPGLTVTAQSVATNWLLQRDAEWPVFVGVMSDYVPGFLTAPVLNVIIKFERDSPDLEKILEMFENSAFTAKGCSYQAQKIRILIARHGQRRYLLLATVFDEGFQDSFLMFA